MLLHLGVYIALLPGVVLLGAGKVLTNDIAGRGYPHYNSIVAGLTLVITVALDLLLIPRMGILGAALASSAAYSSTFLLSMMFYRIVSRRPAGMPGPGQFGAALSRSADCRRRLGGGANFLDRFGGR